MEIFATTEATARHDDLHRRAVDRDVLWNVVSDVVLADIADAVTPQGVVARSRQVARTLADLPGQIDLAVICHDMRDPGNAGAVIRCADAAGADVVVLSGSSVDPHNPKAVRASVGSVFHVPVVMHSDYSDVISVLKDRSVQILAADADADHGLFDDELDLQRATAWVMGNEAQGLPVQVRAACDAAVAVPIYGRAESLNLATAAAVCLYASAREQNR